MNIAKKKIYTSIIQLGSDIEFYKMTVTNITTYAKVNRVTFYRYFDNVEDAIYSLWKKIIYEVNLIIDESKNIYQNMDALFFFIEKHRKEYLMFLYKNPNNSYLFDLEKINKRLTKNSYTGFKSIIPPKLTEQLTLTTTLTFIKFWLTDSESISHDDALKIYFKTRTTPLQDMENFI